MKKGTSVFLVFLFVLIIVSPALAEEAIPDKRVALGKVEITGNGYGYGQLGSWIRDMVKSSLVAIGWTMVDRDGGYRGALREQNLPGIDPRYRVPREEMPGATGNIDLSVRITLTPIQGRVGYHSRYLDMEAGPWYNCRVDVIAQVVDNRTVIIGPVSTNSVQKGSLQGGRIRVSNVRGNTFYADAHKSWGDDLVANTVDEALRQAVIQLGLLYDQVPGQKSWGRITITVPRGTRVGDLIGIFHAQSGASGETCVGQAQVEQILVTGEAVCKVVAGSGESRGCSMQNLSRKIY